MSTLRVNNLTNQANDGGIDFAVQPVIDGLAKAWVNFNGTSTVAIRASYNVSSITDNGTGNYTVNFTNAMPDANFSAVTTSGYSGVAFTVTSEVGPGATRSTGYIVVEVQNTAGAASDALVVNAVIHR
jgi:hypothetical protein